MASEDNLVLYECADRVATISLNRPEKLNAVSDEVVAQLSDALRRFDLDPEAEVAILTGKGRAFSSGADVHQRQLRSRDEFEKLGGPQGWGTNSADLFTRAVNWKPVIAAVHGYVLGLALGLTLECDLIVAEAGTRFQLTETSRGLGASRYWALFHYRNAAAFGDEIALTGRFSPPRKGWPPVSSTASHQPGSTLRSPASWHFRSRKTRRSASAARCARGAGTWSGWSRRRISLPNRSAFI